MPFDGSPTWCPARPTRCRPEATLVGDSTRTTRSTAPMSMPSSSDDVATRPGIRPALRSSSICRRCSRAIEPWWARTSSSPASSFSRCASRSASRRLLVKTMVRAVGLDQLEQPRVDRRPDARAHVAERPTGPPGCSSGGRTSPSRAMSSTGTTTSSSSVFRLPASTISTSRPGPDAAEEPGDRVERPLRRREPDPLHRRRVIRAGAAPGAPATARDGRRAWCRRSRGPRRRSPSRRRAASRGRRW